MRRALVVALAVALSLSGVGAVSDAPTASAVDETPDRAAPLDGGPAATAAASSADPSYMRGDERSRRVELSGEARSDTVGSGWNLGARIAASDGVLASAYGSRTFRTTLERSSLTGEARERFVAERLQAIEDRTEAMRAAERRAVAAYARGDLTTTNFTRTLVATDAEARTLHRATADLEDLSESESNGNFALALQLRLDTFQSPLRQRLAAALRDGTADVRLSLRATETGYVLGAVDDGTYYREAFRYDNRQPEGPKSLTSNAVLGDRQAEVYNVSSPGTQRLYRDAGAYVGRMVYSYADTEITAFFDGGTGEVFFEQRRHVLEDMDRTTAIDEGNGSVRLRVERTFFNGPIRVEVTDPETGEPIDTAVRVGGERVGTTGEDGVLWVVEPPISYAVSVTVDGTTVSESVLLS
jgi:hypothetical protein